MEWFNPKAAIKTAEELYEITDVQEDLNEYGKYTSLYDIKLLPKVNKDELYIMTSEGKAYEGDTIKCKATKQKDKIRVGSIYPVVNPDNGTFQFKARFDDGTGIDARGEYAKTQLKIIQKRRVKYAK